MYLQRHAALRRTNATRGSTKCNVQAERVPVQRVRLDGTQPRDVGHVEVRHQRAPRGQPLARGAEAPRRAHRRPRLHPCAREEPRRLWRDGERAHTVRPRRLAEDHHAVRIAAEGGDRLRHPRERGDLIALPVGAARAAVRARQLLARKEAEGVQPV